MSDWLVTFGCWRPMSRVLCGMLWRHGFWFRIFGYGVRVQDRSKEEALFSEREGLLKVYRIGRYSILLLHPGNNTR